VSHKGIKIVIRGIIAEYSQTDDDEKIIEALANYFSDQMDKKDNEIARLKEHLKKFEVDDIPC